MPDLRLRVGGREYGGWQTARVTRSLEAISGSFDLSISDKWPGQPRRWPIREEDECELVIDGETVITGWVDRRSLSISAQDHGITVRGRDRAGALVDCSAVLSTWEYLGASILTLVQQVATPYGIPVKLQAGLAPPRAVEKLTIDPGDSAFDVIERACRMAGVLPVSDGKGGIVLTRAGAVRAATALVEGENILAGGADFDSTGRYRRYVVTGQRQGTDEAYGELAAAVTGSARDEGVRRAERVLMVRAEAGVTPALARERAEWEATVRAGRAETAGVTVQGWTQRDGKLWAVNSLVAVRSESLDIDGERLITQVTWSVSSRGGTVTELALTRPDAFKPVPVVPVGSTGRWKELATTPAAPTATTISSHRTGG